MTYKKVLLKRVELAKTWVEKHPDESRNDIGGKGEQMYLASHVDVELIENYKNLDKFSEKEIFVGPLSPWVVDQVIYYEQKVAKFKRLGLKGDRGKNWRADYIKSKKELLEWADKLGAEEMKGIFSIPLPPKEEAYEVLDKIRQVGYDDSVVRAASDLMGFAGKLPERTKNIKERNTKLTEETDKIFDKLFPPKES